MKVITKKVKTMVISRTTITPAVKIRLGNEDVDQVKPFVYVGHQITKEGTCDPEIYIYNSILK